MLHARFSAGLVSPLCRTKERSAGGTPTLRPRHRWESTMNAAPGLSSMPPVATRGHPVAVRACGLLIRHLACGPPGSRQSSCRDPDRPSGHCGAVICLKTTQKEPGDDSIRRALARRPHRADLDCRSTFLRFSGRATGRRAEWVGWVIAGANGLRKPAKANGSDAAPRRASTVRSLRRTASREDAMEKYCPECRSVCGGDACPMDEQGRCTRCGKPPVAYADRDRSWLWCMHHREWHDKSCAEDQARHCCAPPRAA
jgi:hypothetical protein